MLQMCMGQRSENYGKLFESRSRRHASWDSRIAFGSISYENAYRSRLVFIRKIAHI